VVVAHEDGAGEIDAYAIYRIKEGWAPNGRPDARAIVREVVSSDGRARAQIWRYLLSLDLVRTVQAEDHWIDEPVQWLLTDPRTCRVVSMHDFLWVRLIDVPAALSARTFAVPGRLVIEVDDPFIPDAGGRFAIERGPGGSECRRTDEEPDLVMGAPRLGSVYVGGVAFGTLAAAGRIEERTPGACVRADALFGVRPTPWCITNF
jgi:predicted acetyltransferase